MKRNHLEGKKMKIKLKPDVSEYKDQTEDDNDQSLVAKIVSADFTDIAKMCRMQNCLFAFVPESNQPFTHCPNCNKRQRTGGGNVVEAC